MDGLEFTSKLVEHLAWPVVVLYVVSTQKSAVGGLIRNIKKLKWGDKEAEIAERTERLTLEANQLVEKPVEPLKLEAPLPPVQFAGGGTMKTQGSATLTVGNKAEPKTPNAVQAAAQAREAQTFNDWLFGVDVNRDEKVRTSGLIIEDWKLMEEGIRRIALDVNPVTSSFLLDPMNLLMQLVSQKIISEDTYDLVKGLRRVRNDVAHSNAEPSYTTALEYMHSSRKALQRMHAEATVWQSVMESIKSPKPESERRRGDAEFG